MKKCDGTSNSFDSIYIYVIVPTYIILIVFICNYSIVSIHRQMYIHVYIVYNIMISL